MLTWFSKIISTANLGCRLVTSELSPGSPSAGKSLLEVGGDGKTVAAWKPAVRDLVFRPDQEVPPPYVVQVVVRPLQLQVVIVSEGVVGPYKEKYMRGKFPYN